MLSYKTCVELIHVIEHYQERFVDRLLQVFDLKHKVSVAEGRFNKDKKANVVLSALRYPPVNGKGPFTSDFRMDILTYLIDHYYRAEDADVSSPLFPKKNKHIPYNERFEHAFPSLAYSLKRDGYRVCGREIIHSLPPTLEAAQTENELDALLDRYNLAEARVHLQQAISNHSQGNWEAANGQFRPFIESLLIGICQRLLPRNTCNSVAAAIQLLSNSLQPAFLQTELNEVEHGDCKKPFVEGLWKRMHPAGAHRGTSSEADCTFRYHISIVFAHYLLKRLEDR